MSGKKWASRIRDAGRCAENRDPLMPGMGGMTYSVNSSAGTVGLACCRRRGRESKKKELKGLASSFMRFRLSDKSVSVLGWNATIQKESVRANNGWHICGLFVSKCVGMLHHHSEWFVFCYSFLEMSNKNGMGWLFVCCRMEELLLGRIHSKSQTISFHIRNRRPNIACTTDPILN